MTFDYYCHSQYVGMRIMELLIAYYSRCFFDVLLISLFTHFSIDLKHYYCQSFAESEGINQQLYSSFFMELPNKAPTIQREYCLPQNSHSQTQWDHSCLFSFIGSWCQVSSYFWISSPFNSSGRTGYQTYESIQK